MEELSNLLSKVHDSFEVAMKEQKQIFAEQLEKERQRLIVQLKEKEDEFNEIKKRIEKEKEHIFDQKVRSCSKVKLDVGGKIFHTSVTTLTSYPESMLGAMFSGRYTLDTDEDGTVFIDRNGYYFEYIIDWLRTGRLVSMSMENKLGLLEEAKYYSLDSLVKIIEEDIEDNKESNKITQKEFIKLVLKTDDRRPLYLVGCDLREIHLAYQNLAVANLDGANLKGMNLEYVNFSGASLQHANLENANLKGANLENAILMNANLKGANLTSANIGFADLSNANLSSVSLSSANLSSANFSETNLSNANLSSVTLEGAKFNNANLENADFSNAGGRATFTGAKGKPKQIAIGK